MRTLVATLVLVLSVAPARGEDRATAAADVAGAPRPGNARNVSQGAGGGAGRHLLWIPRGLLLVPRWTFWAAMAPARGTLYAWDRYGIGTRIGAFLASDGPVAVFPMARFETGLGVSYGLGLQLADMLGRDEGMRFRFVYGGEVRQIYGGKLWTGTLLSDRFELDGEVELQLLQSSRFFGFGMRDLQPAEGAGAGNDPTEVAVLTRYDQDLLRSEVGLDWNVSREVTGRISAAILQRSFDAADVAEVYDPDALVGLTSDVSNVYTEALVRYDTRRQPSRYRAKALPSDGWKLEGFAGWAQGWGDDPSGYVRYGADAMRFIDLFDADRILILRGRLEAVTADLDEIPFVDLPGLGGSRILRGYHTNRFRDRVITALSAEYRYPLNRGMSGYVWLDSGGAWRNYGSVDPGELRYGTGIGLQLHTKRLFLMRVQIGFGDDGAIANLSFNPASRVKRRTKRK